MTTLTTLTKWPIEAIRWLKSVINDARQLQRSQEERKYNQ